MLKVAAIIKTYLEYDPAIQKVIKDMIDIIYDNNTSYEDKELALSTLKMTMINSRHIPI